MSRITIKNDKMTVQLFRDEAESFMAKAINKSEKYTKIAPDHVSPYGFNHAHSHFVGLVTEHAAWVLFTEIEEMLNVDLKIDPSFHDDTRDKECDINVGGLRVEVKGIKSAAWKQYGPCISTRQLSKIERKADVVLWALYNERTQEVVFEGWNPVSEVRAITPVLTGKEGKQIENYKVLDILRPLNDLAFKHKEV